jgi:hypothetical protein
MLETADMARTPETLKFAERLKEALTRCPKKADTPALLSVQFNLRYDGERVTNQAVQKWLVGDNLPTPDKIKTLADMCGVSVEWLHHGYKVPQPVRLHQSRQAPYDTSPSPLEANLLANFRLLSEQQQEHVAGLVADLAFDRKIWL